MPTSSRHPGRAAFSLLELLVVIAILALLLGLLLSAVQKARDNSLRSRCAFNLHNIGLAIFHYEGAHGRLPPGGVQGPFPEEGIPRGAEHGLWPFLLPHLEQTGLARNYHLEVSCYHASNQPAAAMSLPILKCPAAPDPNRVETRAEQSAWPPGGEGACTDYAPIRLNPILKDRGWIEPVANLDSALPINGLVPLTAIPDGCSNTLLVVESAGRPNRWRMGRAVPRAPTPGGPWASATNGLEIRGFVRPRSDNRAPCAVNCTNEGEIYSFHSRGANALLADGSVRFLNDGLALRVLASLVTRAGGEVISSGDF
jgi:prepilin-type N-terminal cleavage/methylation domain-containing protein/prepilin-type processing-associated H-X9-DG protein